MNQENNNYKEIKDMGAKDRFVVIGIISVIIMFFSPMVISLTDMFKDIFGDSILARVVVVIIGILIIFFIIKKFKKAVRLAEVVELGTARTKEVKIIDFEYSKSEDSRWYYIILSDWEKKYKSFYYKWAKIIGKTDEELKKDKFYEEHWIILDLQNRDVTKRELDQKISSLESQKMDANMFKKIKLNSEIDELKYKKNDLELYHLHTEKWDFYIWDTDKVLIDPDDTNNYILESEKQKI